MLRRRWIVSVNGCQQQQTVTDKTHQLPRHFIVSKIQCKAIKQSMQTQENPNFNQIYMTWYKRLVSILQKQKKLEQSGTKEST